MEILVEEKKIVVIQTAFLGDAILSLPFIQRLSKQYPGYKIDVITIEQDAEIFKASPFVSDVIILDKRNQHRSVFALKRFASEVKNRNYSLLFSLHRSLRTSLLVLFLEIPESYGFDNSTLPFVYKYRVKYDHTKHEAERNLLLVVKNTDSQAELPLLKTDESIKTKIDSFIQKIAKDRKFVAIAPGTVWETKRYPKKQFIEIIKHLVARDYFVFLIGSKSEFELCSRVKKELPKNIENAAGLFSVIESVELLKRCSLLITNDSAPTHLGMCADIPVLTIYCSTVPQFGFYPYNKKSEYVSLEGLFCKPCGIHGYKKCPLQHFKCGNSLQPQIVVEKIDKMLDEK